MTKRKNLYRTFEEMIDAVLKDLEAELSSSELLFFFISVGSYNPPLINNYGVQIQLETVDGKLFLGDYNLDIFQLPPDFKITDEMLTDMRGKIFGFLKTQPNYNTLSLFGEIRGFGLLGAASRLNHIIALWDIPKIFELQREGQFIDFGVDQIALHNFSFQHRLAILSPKETPSEVFVSLSIDDLCIHLSEDQVLALLNLARIMKPNSRLIHSCLVKEAGKYIHTPEGKLALELAW